jgi:hypothetical protein
MSEFTVNDRRTFSKDGSLNPESGIKAEDKERDSSEEIQKEDPRSSQGTGKSATGSPGRGESGAEDLFSDFPPSITALFIGLATSALSHLGERGPEDADPVGKDLPSAKRFIDLLGILQIKTKGNLEPEEDALLQALLYDLRMKYVKLTRG